MSRPEHLVEVNKKNLYQVSLGWPISFNSYKDRNGRTSKIGREWRDTVVDDIWRQLGAGHMSWQRPEPLLGRVGVWWEMWWPDDKRRRDLDNFTGKHCLDSLVKAGLMQDDCLVWETHHYKRGPWERGQVLVTIAEV